ncbi:MAG: hypothetical protein QMD14_05250 [Candidatus Aenigmarchaeota archaeon]|nr:hypothetical protein [Candidatus Aenigmarchaeota archaeon]
MVELIPILLRDLPGILLSGIIVGVVAKVFRVSFVKGFVAGALSKIVIPFVAAFIPYFPYSFIVLPILVYFLFIWILCRFSPLKSLIISICVCVLIFLIIPNIFTLIQI